MTHNICLLNDSFPPIIDGVANAVVNYGKVIESGLGHAVVATPEHPQANDSAFPFPVYRYPGIDLQQLTGYIAGVPFSPPLLGGLQTHGVELLHTHCPIVSTYLARQLREPLHAPVVLTYHTKFDIDIANVLHSRLLQESSIRALVQNINACDAVWVVSEGAGTNLRSLGYQGDYTVMPNGVDLSRGIATEEAVAAATAGFDLPHGIPVYLFVGRIMWYKGLRLILNALVALKSAGQDFRMVFIGKGGDLDEVTAYTQELGLQDRCFFPGAVTDREVIRAWYTRADLFLFPSTFDTNGLVVREAAACSLASVLVRGSCAAEGVSDGHNALLIDENADSLAARLREVGSDLPLLRRLGENAAQELYTSWAQAVHRAWEEYGLVLERYRSGQYPPHDAPMDTFLNANGELMASLHQAQQDREHLLHQLQQDFQDLVAGQNALLTDLRTRQQELKQEVREKTHELWEQLERYW